MCRSRIRVYSVLRQRQRRRPTGMACESTVVLGLERQHDIYSLPSVANGFFCCWLDVPSATNFRRLLLVISWDPARGEHSPRELTNFRATHHTMLFCRRALRKPCIRCVWRRQVNLSHNYWLRKRDRLTHICYYKTNKNNNSYHGSEHFSAPIKW